jgi:hypothetical protein
MTLPPQLTRRLLQATADKQQLNKQALRLHHSFQEVKQFLENYSRK